MRPEILFYFEIKNNIITHCEDNDIISFIDLSSKLHHGEINLSDGLFYENEVLQFYNLENHLKLKISPLLYKNLKMVDINPMWLLFLKKYFDWRINHDMSLINKVVIPKNIIEPKIKVLKNKSI